MPLVEHPAEETTRRRFYIGAIYGIWAVITAAAGVPALIYLFVPPRLRQSQQWTEVGDISRLPPSSPVAMSFRKNRIDGWKITSEKNTAWVVKQPDNSVVAYGPMCTHLGCPYHWDASQRDFECPCHNSVFGMDGKVASGPAPRPLDRYQVKVEGNKLFLGPLIKSAEQA